MEYVCVNPLQPLPAVVIVAIAGRRGEVVGSNAVLLHRAEDLSLVTFRRLVNRAETRFQMGKDCLALGVNPLAEAHLFIK